MYLTLKTFHVLTVLLSISLFLLRFILCCRQSPLAANPVLKIAPHVNDTFLLTSGMALIGLTGFTPFTPAAPWLSVKLFAVVAYIVCGALALKAKQTWLRWLSFAGALGWLAFIITLAVSKQLGW
ncbi:SirB2 family protein [Photobacterium atrarenae]|uniref:SirB2 family protein n=1 Tax=Photobacterium atrarenae TaxID=865757 RepID=A0ABY5GP62_9GAMM|nr:SirB2 family protein [Photobacterium atrarenae]UTV30916.1 SirB2 family protein [Photobacterium atrarenae]